ncbi:SDR family oxidoreductase [Streptomyces hydrogenans]
MSSATPVRASSGAGHVEDRRPIVNVSSAGDGVRVDCVAPGTVWTDFHAADPTDPPRSPPTLRLGRAGRPEEIAGAVSRLLPPVATYTTGAVLRVAGGMAREVRALGCAGGILVHNSGSGEGAEGAAVLPLGSGRESPPLDPTETAHALNGFDSP